MLIKNGAKKKPGEGKGSNEPLDASDIKVC